MGNRPPQPPRFLWKRVPSVLIFLGILLPIAPLAEDPRITVQLRVLIDGNAITPDTMVAIGKGDSVQLTIQLLDRSGQANDITAHEKISFTSITPWNIVVDQSGQVSAKSAPEFSEMQGGIPLGSVAITYGHVGDQDIGFATVNFEIQQ